MKQIKQYQTESLTKIGRENIRSKLNSLLPLNNNNKQINNQTQEKSKSTLITNDNSKISKPSKEYVVQDNPIISKKYLLKKRQQWLSIPVMKVPKFQIKPLLKLKCMFRQNFKL